MSVYPDKILERTSKAVADHHDIAVRRYLAGETPANQWEPMGYAVAALDSLTVTDHDVLLMLKKLEEYREAIGC